MNDRFYRMMTSHYKELDPKIYYLAELLFYPYIEKDYYGELLRRRGFSISLSRCMSDDDRNLDIVEALILDNAFERAIIEIYSYKGEYQESDSTSWHIALDSEIMNSHEYDEIYKKISKKDESKALFYKIDYNNAIDLIQKYNKIWEQDLNDKVGDYFKSSVQISKVIQEIYRQYELYGSRSFILKNSDFPNIELANTLLFIFLEIGIIEIDFNHQFFRDDIDRLPDEYKIKVTKDIRATNIYSEIIKCTFNSNPTLILFLEQITNLENLAQKRLLKEEKVIDLENNLKIHDFSFIQDEIFQLELEVLKSRTKPTVFRGRVVPGQPTIQCLGDIGLILNEWKRIFVDYQLRLESCPTIENVFIENEQSSHGNSDEENNNFVEAFKLNDIGEVSLYGDLITTYSIDTQSYRFVKFFIDNYGKPLKIEAIRKMTLLKDSKGAEKTINKTDSEWFHGYFNNKNIKELKNYIHNIGKETYVLKDHLSKSRKLTGNGQ